MSISPIKDINGNITHYVSTQRDMTEHQQLEQQFRQAQKMESIGTLVGGIAHDFNNMLASIDGNIYLAKTNLDDSSKLEEKLSTIEKLSSNASEMVKQLLTYARKGSVNLKPLALNAFMQDAFKLAESIVPENIEHLCDTCDWELIVTADATQLQRALMNFLNNACHAVAVRDDPKIVCSTKLFSAEMEFTKKYSHLQSREFARITVSDNGYGIDSDKIDKVIEPFFTKKGVGEGTGLGLSMVQGSGQMHGGGFEGESVIGLRHIMPYIPAIKP